MVGPLVCVDCGQRYVMTASEKVRFAELVKTVQGFQMPRRCPECRKKRRMERPASGSPIPAVVRIAEVFAIPPKPQVEDPVVPVKEEVRVILATKDFEDLVHGRPVVWQGVRVILADIGFKVMREALDRAEDERAKVLYHRNGASKASGETAS
jgi:hypothetical protein